MVEAQTASGFVSTVNPIAVQLPGTDIRQEDMPGLLGLLGHGNAQFTGVRLGRVEQAKLDRGGILRVEGKVDAFLSECGAQRIGLSAPNSRSLLTTITS